MKKLFQKSVRIFRTVSNVIVLMLFFVGNALAQNGWLPPTYFNAGTQLCDNAPYKLVFYDDFNGSTLKPHWVNFHSWSGMQTGPGMWGDHVNWSQGRADTSNNTIDLPENVEVSGGTVKLKLYRETHAWVCSSCGSPSVTRHYTGAYIATPFLRPGGGTSDDNRNWYNSGRFEARLKQPTWNSAYSTWWLYHGNIINEIDITESTGGWNRTLMDNKINTHAFRPSGGSNPYFLPEGTATGELAYPSQNFWDIMFGESNVHKQEEWHIYTCDWDSSRLLFFIDGSLVHEIPRFWTWKIVGNSLVRAASGCSPTPGSYYTTIGYPYCDSSNSNMRFAITSESAGSSTSSRTFLDQTEIDYVKVWQRHPERDGHTEICTGPALSISGPTLNCADHTYTISAPQPGGSWLLLSSAPSATGAPFVIAPGTNTASSVKLNLNPASSAVSARLVYIYPNATCPEPMMKDITVFKGNGFAPSVQFVRSTTGSNTQTFLLSTAAQPGHTYQWYCNWFIPTTVGGGHTSAFSGTGPVIISPNIPTYGTSDFKLTYDLIVTNSCGTKTYRGLKQNFFGIRQKPSSVDADEHMFHSAEVMLTDLDNERYEEAVAHEMDAFIFPENVTESEVANKESRVRYDKLYPYLVEEDMPWEGGSPDPSEFGKRASVIDSTKTSATLVFPNPASDRVTVQIGSQFDTQEPISLRGYLKISE